MKVVLYCFTIFIFFASSLFAQVDNQTDGQQIDGKQIDQKVIDQLKQNLNQQKTPDEPKTEQAPTLTAPEPMTEFILPEFAGRMGANVPAFGYQIFNYMPTTFEPGLNIPTPKNYVIGPGDQITITLWGETQLVHNLTVSKNGDIYVPDVGIVMVNGLSLDQVRSKLFALLSQKYSTLNVGTTEGPTTKMNITTGTLRSVKVYVLGEVRKPGGYTLPALSTSFTVLYYCGGPTLRGSLRNVQIIRKGKIISEIDLYDYFITGVKNNDVRLEDEDILFVPPAGRRVAIFGSVSRPAVFELKKGEILRDVIRFAGGPTFNAYFDRVHMQRIIPFQERNLYSNNVLDIDLNFKGIEELRNAPHPLEDGDVIEIFGVSSLPENMVNISGNVKKPGRYQLTKNMTIRDLVMKADSLFSDSFTPRATLIRQLPNGRQDLITFDVKKAMTGDPSNNLILKNLDQISIYKEESFKPERTVSISGQVNKPGTFKRFEKMTLSELITLAGGFTDFAETYNIEITRNDTLDTYVYAQKQTVSVPKEFWKVEKANDFKLQDYDQIFVKTDPKKLGQRSIAVTGEVIYPGAYVILNEQETVYDFILRAGGLKTTAYIEGMYINRTNPYLGQFYQKQRAITPDSLVLQQFEDKNLLNPQFVNEEFSRRIPIEWNTILKDTTIFENYVLQAGDEIVIPRNPNVIYVMGEVSISSSVPYRESAGLEYYINQAGGYADVNYIGEPTVILPNGRKWQPSGWFFIKDPEILPGSFVIVPPYYEPKSNTWDGIKDVVTLLSGAAVVVLTAIAVAK